MVRERSTIPEWNAAEDLDPPVEMSECVDLEAMGQLAVVAGFAKRSLEFEAAEEHTLDHVNCPACKAANVALQAEKINISGLPFSEARKFWALLRGQSTTLKVRTHERDQEYMDALEMFFGKLRLRDITPGHLRGYQIARMHNLVRAGGQEVHPWTKPAANSVINHELSVLQQILSHCRLWARIKPYYFPLDVPKWSPREILSEEDEEEFFKTAAANPECALAYWIAAITNNTTASGCELRGLRLSNIFLRDPKEISEIYVPEDAVKNESRPRKLPLNPLARWAIEQCYKRALQLGACEPDHYLFPFRDRRKNKYDPERPPSRWVFRRSWDKLREVTGFKELCPHDLRHHCITRLLENEVNENTVIALAGHVNKKMLEYYAHQRKRVKYDAVMAIADTNKGKKKTSVPKKKPPVSARPVSERRRNVG